MLVLFIVAIKFSGACLCTLTAFCNVVVVSNPMVSFLLNMYPNITINVILQTLLKGSAHTFDTIFLYF